MNKLFKGKKKMIIGIAVILAVVGIVCVIHFVGISKCVGNTEFKCIGKKWGNTCAKIFFGSFP